MLDTFYYPIKILANYALTRPDDRNIICDATNCRRTTTRGKKQQHQNDTKGRLYPMESSNSGSLKVPFLQQVLQNKFLLLTLMLAVSAAAYFCIGLFFLLR